MGDTAAKPRRSYLKVPEDLRNECELMAAAYDVPIRSMTRVVFCVGLDVLRHKRVDIESILAALKEEGAELVTAV